MAAHIHRTGQVDLAQIEVLLATGVPAKAIEPGDLLFASVAANITYANPITEFVWDTNLATTQTAAALVFLGVASGRSRLASTDTRDLKVLVNMDGTYEMEANSAVYEVGQYVGPAKAAGNALINKVEAVATKALACGIVVENSMVAATRIKVRLLNTPPKR